MGQPAAIVVNLRGGPVIGPMLRIDRKTPWGNPFKIEPGIGRELVVNRFRQWWYADPQGRKRLEFIAALDAVRNPLIGPIQLACWCSPLPCHGDVLAEYAQRAQAMR